MMGRDCRSELLVQARRRALTSTETMALHSHLVDCQSCRLAKRLVEAFDHEPAVVAVNSITPRVMSEVARRWARESERRCPTFSLRLWRPARIAAVAVALVLTGGTVGAVWLLSRPKSIDLSSKSLIIAPVANWSRAAPLAAPPLPTSEPSAASRPPVVRHVSPPLSAALLLQRASESRRRGDKPRAIILYRRLQQAFPTSPEAVVSAPPLGGLFLDGGAALPALREFDRYLRTAPTGVLVPEALYGRARALRALGDVTEERGTWRRLVVAFPDSPYAPLARKRLEDLQ